MSQAFIVKSNREDIKKLESSYVVKYKMVRPLWKTVWQLLKQLNRITMLVYNSAPRYVPNRIENMCSHKNSCVTVCSIIIHDSEKVGATQMSNEKHIELKNNSNN